MDFNLKQWRDHHSEQQQQQQEEDQDSQSHLHTSSVPSSALPLFVPQPNTTMSAYSNADHSTKFPKMESYFSLSQWQELQLQALIFRHMIVGADVPPELLHLVKKSLIESPYYLSHSLHQYYPHYQPALLQSGYWGKGAMDPEPGRCRRTDGKKWRCSRDVVAGQKYCERHMHRGRNRSRKPVEIATSAAAPYGGAQTLKTNHSIFRQGAAPSAAAGGGRGGGSHFTLSGTSHSSDLFHLDRRPCDSIIEAKVPFQPQHDEHPANARTLRHFFDDWPKPDNANAATNLSISMPENPSSDFSLKLGTGNEEEPSTNQRDIKPQMINWGITSWDTNLVANPMGGPLAEALRSSTSTSSPTSVLHRLPPREVSS